MPRKAHGEEHLILNICQIPRRASTEGIQDESNLPEPGPLQDDETWPQELQKYIVLCEEFHEGNQTRQNGGKDQKLVHKNIQHFPTVSVVVEDKRFHKDGIW